MDHACVHAYMCVYYGWVCGRAFVCLPVKDDASHKMNSQAFRFLKNVLEEMMHIVITDLQTSMLFLYCIMLKLFKLF